MKWTCLTRIALNTGWITRANIKTAWATTSTVYAVGNPEVGRAKNRYEKAHEKGSGFGLVTIDTEKKTYLIESFRFLIDPTDGKASNQFPGWPVTLHQNEMAGQNKIG